MYSKNAFESTFSVQASDKTAAKSGFIGEQKVIIAMSKAFSFERSDNSRNISKSFSISMPFRTSKVRGEEEKPKMSLSEIKLKAELSFQDLMGTDTESLRYKIRGAREVKDLWMLRADIHQVISRHISQQEAAKRINALLPCFEHWIPAQTLTPI